MVRGRVQGVGFRPGLYRSMTMLGCGGCVRNTPEGVCVEVEGPEDAITHLLRNFAGMVPSRARIDELEVFEAEPTGETSFHIEKSTEDGPSLLPVPPDFAICPDCERELVESGGRRTGYAFNTCTCCGPRFTIARGVPFDRVASVMDEFPLCAECSNEFKNPENRRFHAQTMSCPECGPALSFFCPGCAGGDGGAEPFRGSLALEAAARYLKNGMTVAVKGVGGFHLACDAMDAGAVARIRACKGRPHKPLGVMVADMQTARCICHADRASENLLCSERAPMVLLRKKPTGILSGGVAPGLQHVGVMLPYTPFHRLLFDQEGTPPVLVMTSCNRSEEPIATGSFEVASGLSDMVDGILDHNRRIENRCDDSVAGIIAGSPVVFRRSRGYVPEPVMLGYGGPPVLAVGAMWKNTFTLTSGRRAYMSQHIGDVSDADNEDYFEDTYEKISSLLRIEPEIIACDMHPDYPSTNFARRLARQKGLELRPVQHHRAHILSCLAEHGVDGPVIGVSMDGTGYGEDGNVWGGEFFVADARICERKYHFKYIPMPGGERAVAEPYRMALSYLSDTYDPGKALSIMETRGEELPLQQVCGLIGRGDFSPPTSSCGRLFDAVASILGVRHICTYEGQAACELEAIADGFVEDAYPFVVRNRGIEFSQAIACAVEEKRAGENIGAISARFHNTVAKVVVDTCCRLRSEEGLRVVALSGGVMQNAYLVERCIRGLRAGGFSVLTHGEVPPNDAGISLGQALAALVEKNSGIY